MPRKTHTAPRELTVLDDALAVAHQLIIARRHYNGALRTIKNRLIDAAALVERAERFNAGSTVGVAGDLINSVANLAPQLNLETLARHAADIQTYEQMLAVYTAKLLDDAQRAEVERTLGIEQ